MNKTTRKHITPRALATALGVVAALALMAAVVWLPGAAQAQTGPNDPFAPPAPTDVTATEGAGQITLSWTAGTGRTEVTGYEVERKVGDGSYAGVSPAHAGTDPSYVDSNVQAGMTYQYRVRANSAGTRNSGWVESNAVTVSAAAQQLDAPANPMAEADDNRQLTVSWDAVTGAGGYRVTWSPADANGNTSHELGAGATSYTITHLAPNTTYAIQIVALGVTGTSSNSGAATASGTTLPVAYDLLLSHGEGADATCADRSASRKQCPTDDSEFADGDFVEVESTLGGNRDLIDKATIRAADKRIRLHAEVNTDSPAETTTVTIRIQNSDDTMMFGVDPGITYNTAGLNAPGVRSIEDGTLDIQIRDAASRVFDVYVTCMGASDDLQGTLDLEVRNEDQTLVAQATITCAPPVVPPTPEERVSACYTISGTPDHGDDPDTTDMVEGDDIELLTSDKSVVVTVSAFEKTYKTTTVGTERTIEDPVACDDWDPASVFIRLVDMPGSMPMVDDDDGFVDENGLINDHGQVVGLSSGGELMFDISETVPAPREGDDPIGVVRGTFRVFTPADVGVGDKYYVELYDNLRSGRITHQNAETGAEQDYERVSYCSDPASAEDACEVPNNDPMAVGSITAQSVMVGQRQVVDVSGNFRDADAGDTLTYEAMSNNTAVATVAVNGAMVTISGVMVGSATITVSASDGMGGTAATQTIAVTVTAGMLTAPTGMNTCVGGGADPGCANLAAGSVEITWTDGANADRHLVALFDSNWNVDLNRISNLETDGMATFENVPSGAYHAVVFAIQDDENGNAEEFEAGIQAVTVP